MRKDILTTGEIYHVFTRSIADYVVFNNDDDFERMRQLIKYYQIDYNVKYSDFIAQKIVQKEGFNNMFNVIKKGKETIVQIIAYCFMPTHIHLVVKQLAKNGVSLFSKDILNSYSKYFNIQHKRKGPLWESRFKNVLVKDDEQLRHLVRYLHINPTTSKLVKKPENWEFSSYREYLGMINDSSTLCQFSDVLDINPAQYRRFINDQISYQQELAKIKKLLFD